MNMTNKKKQKWIYSIYDYAHLNGFPHTAFKPNI